MRNHAASGFLSVLTILVLSVLFTGLACQPTPSPSPWEEMLIKHKWDAIPDNWVSLGHPPNGTTIKLHISLKANREDALIDVLHEVSHPRHPKYGAHLSREQAAELVAPHPDTLELVLSWLKYNGVPPSSISKTNGGSWITIAGVPVSQANKILRASYELYCHAGTNETILRTASYALPTALHIHVKTIAPTTAFTSMRLHQQTPLSHFGGEAAPANVTSGEPSDVLSRVDQPFVDPAFLRWLYRTPLNNPAATVRNKLGIAGLENEFPNEIDLNNFIRRFRSDVDSFIATSRIVTIVSLNNGVDYRFPPGKRGNIDTQFSVALTYPIPIEYYIIGGAEEAIPKGLPVEGDQYLEWLRYMIDLENVPWTVSVPYYNRELDLSAEYMEFLCDLFKTLGSRGVSILVASGDTGVGHRTKGRIFRFSTSFPASCPYVTSVGGTTGFDPELGSEFSGGGFSTVFERPDYQMDAVTPFVDNIQVGAQYRGLYNPLGRGVPDISMQSTNYAVLWQGKLDLISSTCFSTNTAAAIIALLNDYLVSNNKNPLGFLNYWLYEAGLNWDGLNDVTGGSNPGSSTTDGFSATDGWDPVTGLGSLNYTLLVQHLIKWL